MQTPEIQYSVSCSVLCSHYCELSVTQPHEGKEKVPVVTVVLTENPPPSAYLQFLKTSKKLNTANLRVFYRMACLVE